MTSQDEHNKRVQRQVEMRLREMENQQIPNSEAPFYQTIKHQPVNSLNHGRKKAIFALQLFGIGVAVILAVRIASILAGFVITATLIWVVYSLFFASRK
jgi:hypothetical protein